MIREINHSLSHPLYQAKQVRENEERVARSVGIAMYPLMKNAGQAAFEQAARSWPSATSFVIVCGRGNNAGDGFVFAKLALEAGHSVGLCCANDDINYVGDANTAKEEFVSAGGCITPLNEVVFSDFDVIIDAIFGTGLSRDLGGDYIQLIETINDADLPVLAIDIPSGLCAETGHVFGICVNAAVTVTFIALKIGLFTGRASNHIGRLVLAELGVAKQFIQQIEPVAWTSSQQLLASIKARRPTDHKGHSGRALFIGGNKGFPGAIRMSSEAGLRTGLGLVSVHCHEDNRLLVAQGRPELMISPVEEPIEQKVQQSDVVVIGPGLGCDSWANLRWGAIKDSACVLIVDADALNVLSKKPAYNKHWILTPHPGEAARLLQTTVNNVERDRVSAIKAIQQKYGGICVLKGPGSLVYDGNRLFVNVSGNPGMATGGMGDVLSGIIAGVTMLIPDRLDAAVMAVYIHGASADKVASEIGQRGMLPTDLYPEIQRLVNRSNESC